MAEIKDDTTKIVNEEGATDDDDNTAAAEGATDDSTDLTGDDLDNIDDSEIESQAEESEGRIQGILDKFGYDSLEDLEEDLPNFKSLREKIGDKDADQLIEDSEYLAKVKEFWKQQDEAKKREGETHEETIERLEREKKDTEQKLLDRDEKEAKVREDKRKAKEADRMIKSFNSTVLDEIDKAKDLPKEYKPFVKEYLGVDNPANEINIGMKTEVRKMAKDGMKKVKDFEQAVIKRYLDGKIEVPKISDGKETPVNTEKKPKNLAEARQQLYDTFGVKR